MEPILILRFEGTSFFVLLAALLAYRLLTGGIEMGGLLRDRLDDEAVSAERVQLLVATIAVCFRFIGSALHGDGHSLPDVSPVMLGLFGTSGGVYAAVKGFKAYRASQE